MRRAELLGHDSVADHEIHFRELAPDDYSLTWRGRVALSYAGDDEFRHQFEAHLESIRAVTKGSAQ